jgi:hypothetical protein
VTLWTCPGVHSQYGRATVYGEMNHSKEMIC